MIWTFLIYLQINFHGEGYLECFDKQSVVYLSSESPNILTTLDDDKVYIIGGLVDHNHQKVGTGTTLYIFVKATNFGNRVGEFYIVTTAIVNLSKLKK